MKEYGKCLPHVLIVGKPCSGKSTVVKSLVDKYGKDNLQPLSVLDWLSNKAPVNKSTGCLLEDGDGSGIHVPLMESGLIDVVVELDVPDDICVRWLEHKLEPNKLPVASEREMPLSPFGKAMMRRIGLFTESYEKNISKYDCFPAIFLRVNGYGEKQDIFAVVDAFVDAAVAHRSEDYQLAFTLYGKAAKVAAKFACQEGVAAACCGQGKALLSMSKLKKAVMFLDNSLDLVVGQEPGSINAWARLARGKIKKKLDEHEAQEYFRQLELKAAANEVELRRKLEEKQRWIRPLHNAMRVVEQKEAKVLKNKTAASLYAATFVSYEEEEKKRLRAKYKAYTRDLSTEEIEVSFLWLAKVLQKLVTHLPH